MPFNQFCCGFTSSKLKATKVLRDISFSTKKTIIFCAKNSTEFDLKNYINEEVDRMFRKNDRFVMEMKRGKSSRWRGGRHSLIFLLIASHLPLTSLLDLQVLHVLERSWSLLPQMQAAHACHHIYTCQIWRKREASSQELHLLIEHIEWLSHFSSTVTSFPPSHSLLLPCGLHLMFYFVLWEEESVTLSMRPHVGLMSVLSSFFITFFRWFFFLPLQLTQKMIYFMLETAAGFLLSVLFVLWFCIAFYCFRVLFTHSLDIVHFKQQIKCPTNSGLQVTRFFVW